MSVCHSLTSPSEYYVLQELTFLPSSEESLHVRTCMFCECRCRSDFNLFAVLCTSKIYIWRMQNLELKVREILLWKPPDASMTSRPRLSKLYIVLSVVSQNSSSAWSEPTRLPSFQNIHFPQKTINCKWWEMDWLTSTVTENIILLIVIQENARNLVSEGPATHTAWGQAQAQACKFGGGINNLDPCTCSWNGGFYALFLLF